MKQGITVSGLRCNRLKNPLGFGLGSVPRLSWVVDAPAGTEVETLVEVAADAGFTDILFTSAGQDDINPVCYPVPVGLRPRTRYHWRVTLRAEGYGQACGAAWFETAKLDEPWQAQWITPEYEDGRHPLLFTEFTLPAAAVEARVYICGLGLYELSINGARCSDEYLAPGLCAYDKWLPYQTYDVTAGLQAGGNCVEVALGNGWYKGRYGLVRRQEFHYGEQFACIAELHVLCEDGTSHTICTNTDWHARKSTVLESSIFDGEIRDDTCTDDTLYGVKQAAVDTALLEARRSPPTKIMHRRKPVEVIQTPLGETVLDFGQNMTGWVEFVCRAPRGGQIHLQFGEVLQGGNFYRDNLRTAKAEYRYTSDGAEKLVRPFFTFYGFRYVKLTSWPGEVKPEDFTACVLYSQMEQTGYLTTGSEKVNKLIENTLWGQRGNFLDVPTDCPQRDERMGWTGDAQVFFGTAAFNMDVYAFFSKYCYDLMQEQMAEDGNVPVVIPRHDVTQKGSCAWGDAATIIPWGMYTRYGDKTLLAQQYPSMKAWVEYIHRRDEATGGTRLWKGDFHYCDWLALDGEDPLGNRFGGTERVYLASCFYRHSAGLVAKAAAVLGYTKDATRYAALSDEVRAAIVEEYVTPTGRLAVTTQTAYVLALHFDIIPQQWREKTAYALRLKLKESDYHLRTGFVGTPYLCEVLSQTGSNDIAYRLLLQEDFPSWLYQVNMGATTIWERWNSILPDGSISDTGMNSLNHYSYGSIVEWIYKTAAGIQPLEAAPGFRAFRLAPQPDASLGSVDAVYHAAAGTVRSRWQYLDDGSVEYCFTVPFGAEAQLLLPGCAAETLGPGTHTRRTAPVQGGITLDTPISRIWNQPETKAVFEAELPCLAGMMLFPMMAGERSIRDFMREEFIQLDETQAALLCERLTAAARRGTP